MFLDCWAAPSPRDHGPPLVPVSHPRGVPQYLPAIPLLHSSPDRPINCLLAALRHHLTAFFLERPCTL